MDSVREKVFGFVIDQIVSKEEAPHINDRTNLRERGFFDSISTLKLISFIESEFGIEVRMPDIESGHLSSIFAISKMIHSRMALPL